MTHRSYLVIIQENTPVSVAIKKLHASKQLIALVRPNNNPEQIIGTVTMGMLLKCDTGAMVKSVLTSPVWVPETMEVAELISFLFNEGYSYACVLDEFGSFSGLFSLSIAMNSILGNAFPSSIPIQTNIKGKTMVFSGGQEIAEIEAWLPSSLKSGTVEVRTLNGLLTKFLGKIPKTGDRFAIDGWNFYIMAASSTKIESVLIRKRNNDDN
jgi:putative hemolysin